MIKDLELGAQAVPTVVCKFRGDMRPVSPRTLISYATRRNWWSYLKTMLGA